MQRKSFTTDESAQTSMEYVLMVAGVVLFVTIATLILRGQIIGPITNTVADNASVIKKLIRNVS